MCSFYTLFVIVFCNLYCVHVRLILVRIKINQSNQSINQLQLVEVGAFLRHRMVVATAAAAVVLTSFTCEMYHKTHR